MYSSEDNQILIACADGTTQTITPVGLRQLCRSPSNDPSQLPSDLAPLNFMSMGVLRPSSAMPLRSPHDSLPIAR